MRKVLLLALLLAILAPPLGLAEAEQAEVTAQDVYEYINCCLEVSAQTKSTLIQAFQQGFEEGVMAPERALQLLQEVNESGAELQLREQILLIIAEALLKGVPPEMLVNKVLEGLKKGVPMSVILAEIGERKATLEEVKALLESKGFKAGIELRIGSATIKVNIELTGLVITDVAGALEDYVRDEQDLADPFAVKQAVILRLQRDGSVPAAITEWIRTSISAEELGRIAQNIAARLEELKGA